MPVVTRTAAKALLLSAGTAGLLALGSGVASADTVPGDSLVPLDGLDVTLPAEEAVPATDLVSLSAPTAEERQGESSGALTTLLTEDMEVATIAGLGEQVVTYQAEVNSLLDDSAEAVPTEDVRVPQHAAASALPDVGDPVGLLDLSSDGELPVGVPTDGLAL